MPNRIAGEQYNKRIFPLINEHHRFCMFFEKFNGIWGILYVRHFYEKDKLLPVDPRHVPEIDDERLSGFPSGYRYLAYCQEVCMPGCIVKKDMPGIRGKEHDDLLKQVKTWLEGEEINL